MKYTIILFIACLHLFSCNNQSESANGSTNTIESADDEVTEEEIEENNLSESYHGLQDGSYTIPDEIRTHLRTFCNYDVNTQKGDFEYQSIVKDADGNYTQACDYDAVGSYSINTDEGVDQSFIASNDYPFLEHSYDDTNIYLIEEINISDLGRKISMTVRYMPFESNSGYGIDMSVSSEKVELTINESGQLVITDRVYTEAPRYFIAMNQLDALPNPECDENYR